MYPWLEKIHTVACSSRRLKEPSKGTRLLLKMHLCSVLLKPRRHRRHRCSGLHVLPCAVRWVEKQGLSFSACTGITALKPWPWPWRHSQSTLLLLLGRGARRFCTWAVVVCYFSLLYIKIIFEAMIYWLPWINSPMKGCFRKVVTGMPKITLQCPCIRCIHGGSSERPSQSCSVVVLGLAFAHTVQYYLGRSTTALQRDWLCTGAVLAGTDTEKATLRGLRFGFVAAAATTAAAALVAAGDVRCRHVVNISPRSSLFVSTNHFLFSFLVITLYLLCEKNLNCWFVFLSRQPQRFDFATSAQQNDLRSRRGRRRSKFIIYVRGALTFITLQNTEYIAVMCTVCMDFLLFSVLATEG